MDDDRCDEDRTGSSHSDITLIWKCLSHWSCEIYDCETGVWTVIDPMTTARVAQTATRLAEGSVLVAGGSSIWKTYIPFCEIYDVETGVWTETTMMTNPRSYHTATLFPDGKVFVAGGTGTSRLSLASCEIYDSVSKTWTQTGLMKTGRESLTTTLLLDGKILVTGGIRDGNRAEKEDEDIPLSSCEIYDPVTKTLSPTGEMSTTQAYHTATRLEDSKVLMVGVGREIYDGSTGSWSSSTSSKTGMFLGMINLGMKSLRKNTGYRLMLN